MIGDTCQGTNVQSATEIQGEPAIRGECRFCGDETTLYADSTLCENCDGNSIYCSVCDERLDGDDSCRHLLWLQHGEWGGVGSNECDTKRCLRDAMFRVAGELGWAQAKLLSAALRSHKYHFFYTDSMLGGSMHLHLTFRGLPNKDGAALTDGLQKIVNRLQYQAEDEELVEALQWLWTLWAGDPKGNLCDLKPTPDWDTAAADAIDAAFSAYGPPTTPGNEGSED